MKQTEVLESQLLESNKQTETLKQQLGVTEANYHAIESKLNELTTELTTAQESNTNLKDQIANLNSMTATLQTQLNEKQQNVRQQRSMVDVNSKQLEVGQINLKSMQTEIDGLDEKLQVYLTKQNELNEYQKTVEEQHSQLESKYKDLALRNDDLTEREKQLEERNAQIEEQEKIYNDHVTRLQEMFTDLSKRKEVFEKANDELEKQRAEYANSVQDLSERQIQLAMGHLPDDAKDIISKKNDANVSKFVDSTILPDDEEKTEKTQSDVFDGDIPVVPSQSETAGESLNEVAGTLPSGNNTEEEAAQTLADRFEGDLNEYGIPRSQSLTSSVANNAPQSVGGEAELAEPLDERLGEKSITKEGLPVVKKNVSTEDEEDSHIPGEWDTPEVAETPTSTANRSGTMDTIPAIADTTIVPTPIEEKNVVDELDNVSDNSIEQSPDMSAMQDQSKSKTIDEEFPPMQELHIDESDSSDDEFEDTREVLSPALPQKEIQPRIQAPPSIQERAATPKQPDYLNTAQGSVPPTSPAVAADEFDDEFAGLEQAAVEEEGNDDDLETDGNQHSPSSMEGFETIGHNDLDNELQQNAFTGTITTDNNADQRKAPSQLQSTESTLSNDEWNEIFAGFGNGKQQGSNTVPPATSEPQQSNTQSSFAPPPIRSPVNRGIATTPKSLAIEELSGMGFTEEEATKALEKFNWDLDAATNYLLDNA